MKLLTEYQITEITLGSLYFFFVYIIGSYIMNGEILLLDIIGTTILFSMWLFFIKLIPNYVTFNK